MHNLCRKQQGCAIYESRQWKCQFFTWPRKHEIVNTCENLHGMIYSFRQILRISW
jgi:hypothetical protein